jgi:hypothetical protein
MREQHTEPGDLVIGEVAAGPMTLERRAHGGAAGLQQRLVSSPRRRVPEQRRQPAVGLFGRATHRLSRRALDGCHPAGEGRPIGQGNVPGVRGCRGDRGGRRIVRGAFHRATAGVVTGVGPVPSLVDADRVNHRQSRGVKRSRRRRHRRRDGVGWPVSEHGRRVDLLSNHHGCEVIGGGEQRLRRRPGGRQVSPCDEDEPLVAERHHHDALARVETQQIGDHGNEIGDRADGQLRRVDRCHGVQGGTPGSGQHSHQDRDCGRHAGCPQLRTVLAQARATQLPQGTGPRT